MSSSIIDRVRKLLSLAQRAGSPEEAALAAQRAQELMTEHRLAEADLALASGENLKEEEVVEEVLEGDFSQRRAQQWRVLLAGALAPSFGCRIYYWQGSNRIGIIGRESDVQTMRYIQGHLALEIQRLVEQGWAEVKRENAGLAELPSPSRWRNSFRLGAVHTIRERLQKERRVTKAPRPAPEPEIEAVPAAEVPSAAQALVLASEVAAQKKVEAKWKARFPRGGRGSGFSGPSLSEGYYAGRSAGESVNLDNRARGAIGGAKPRIEG